MLIVVGRCTPHSTYSIIELFVLLQPFILALGALPVASEIHASELPNLLITLIEDKILRLMNLDLLVNVHSAIFSVDVNQTGNSHGVLHTLLYRCRIGGVKYEVNEAVWMAVERKGRVRGWEMR